MYIISKREDGKWEVKKQGAKRASKILDSQMQAINYCEDNNYEYKLNSNDAVGKTVNSIKKHGILKTIILILIIGILAVGGWFIYEKVKPEEKPGTPLIPLEPSIPVEPNTDKPVEPNTGYPTVIDGANFSIHFLELGNEYTGDATYIKAGDNDILIDAGSRKNSAPVIKRYLDQFVTDGKLEYVIATHAHQDHIAGFVGSKENNSRTGILYQYKIGTIIDFDYTTSDTQLYKDYIVARDYAVSNGAVHYTASQCFDNKDGAKRSYSLGEGLSLDIIYNKYYFEVAKDENDHSVCTMFNAGDHHFLLTGDLEKDGEEALAKYYDGSTKEKTLPEVDVFKAGHHGSPTSSGDALLNKIKPKICCVCCCGGATEYTNRNDNTFPSQAFIDRIAKHTDSVYVTSRYNEKTDAHESFNGNIVVLSNGKELALNFSNNDKKLKDSDWFNEKIYVKTDDKGFNIVSDPKTDEFFTSATPGVKEIVRRIWPK